MLPWVEIPDTAGVPCKTVPDELPELCSLEKIIDAVAVLFAPKKLPNFLTVIVLSYIASLLVTIYSNVVFDGTAFIIML